MHYDINLGAAAYRVDTPCKIIWKPTDLQFLHPCDDCEVVIQVTVREVSALPEPQGILCHNGDNLWVWQSADGSEWRKYSANFVDGEPEYMCSHYMDDEIEIFYLASTGIWENVNFYFWNFLHMERVLLRAGALVLHCCYTMYRDEAILFSAPSGTGKTTQGKLWQYTYSSEIINGDKCMLWKKNGVWCACGHPFHGSADECENRDYPIRAIALVRQSQEDRIEQITPATQVKYLFSECTVNNWDAGSVLRALDLVTDLAADVPVFLQHCTLDMGACKVLHRHLYGE